MNRFKMKTRFYRYKWLFAVVALLGGLFLFALGPRVASAAQDCTYTYTKDNANIKRTGCTVNLGNATFEGVPEKNGYKGYAYKAGNCSHAITVKTSDPLRGTLNISNDCKDKSQQGNIEIREYVQESPQTILRNALKGLIDEQCDTKDEFCYDKYNGWIEECNIKALDQAADTSGDKNVEYRNTFGQCMENKSSGKLVKLEVYQALPADIYDQLVEAQETPNPGDNDKTCESEGGAQAWMFCPLLSILDGGVGWLTGQIDKLLDVDESKYNNPSLVEGWRGMRNVALIILIPMMLFMVIGTALNIGPFDAYTVKKALPRMMVAVLFIVLSLEITQFFINVSNVVGRGVEGLLLSVSNSPESLTDLYSANGDGLFTAMLFIGGGAGFLTGAVTLGIVGSLALSAFVALLVGYLVLVIRELLILVMMMLAPLAILVWIFPGNDKLWKTWRFTFTTLLLMFPLIALLITSGKVFANIIDGTENDFTAFFLKIVAFIAPFFLIPATFRYSLGVFGNIAGMINDRSRGFFDKQKKIRESTRAQGMQNFKSGTGVGQIRQNSLVRRVGMGMGAGFKGRYGFGEKGSQAMSQIADLAGSEQVMKDPRWMTINENDGAMRAATFANETQARQGMSRFYRRQITDDKVNEYIGEQALRNRTLDATQARAELETQADNQAGQDAAAIKASIGYGRSQAVAAAKQLATTGTGYVDNYDQAEVIARASGGDKNLTASIAGYNNFISKQKGRNDLAPGAGSLIQASNDMVDRVPFTEPRIAEMTESSWNSGSLYILANAKAPAMKTFSRHWEDQYRQALANGDQAQLERVTIAEQEMKAMLPNSSGENQRTINASLEKLARMRQEHVATGGTFSQQQLQTIDVSVRPRARTYERLPDDIRTQQ